MRCGPESLRIEAIAHQSDLPRHYGSQHNMVKTTSARARLKANNSALVKLQQDMQRELLGIHHIPRTSTAGLPVTVIGARRCERSCPACAIVRRFTEKAEPLASRQRALLIEDARNNFLNDKKRGSAGGEVRRKKADRRRKLTLAARDKVLARSPDVQPRKLVGFIVKQLGEDGTPADRTTVRRHLD